MEDEEYNAVSVLVASTAQDIAQEAKELMCKRAEDTMPDMPTRAGCLLTASIMVMDSAIEAGVNCGKRNPKHPMVMATLHLFDEILAPKLDKLRAIQRYAKDGQ